MTDFFSISLLGKEIICFVDKARRNGNTFKNVLAMAQATDHKFASNRIYMHTVATS